MTSRGLKKAVSLIRATLGDRLIALEMTEAALRQAVCGKAKGCAWAVLWGIVFPAGRATYTYTDDGEMVERDEPKPIVHETTNKDTGEILRTVTITRNGLTWRYLLMDKAHAIYEANDQKRLNNLHVGQVATFILEEGYPKDADFRRDRMTAESRLAIHQGERKVAAPSFNARMEEAKAAGVAGHYAWAATE